MDNLDLITPKRNRIVKHTLSSWPPLPGGFHMLPCAMACACAPHLLSPAWSLTIACTPLTLSALSPNCLFTNPLALSRSMHNHPGVAMNCWLPFQVLGKTEPGDLQGLIGTEPSILFRFTHHEMPSDVLCC